MHSRRNELFLRHVAGDGPFRWNLLEGAKGVQLAELGLKSWKQSGSTSEAQAMKPRRIRGRSPNSFSRST